MKTRRLLIVAVLGLFSVCALAQITDPLKDFVDRSALLNKASVYVVRIDLNMDGKMDVLIARSNESAGRGGYIWKPYLRKGDTYQTVEGLMVFNLRSYYLPSHEGYDTPLVVTYVGGGGHQSAIMFNKMEDNEIVRGTFAESAPSEEILQEYSDLLTDDKLVHVQQIPLTVLLAKYPLRVYTDERGFYSGTMSPDQILRLDSPTSKPATLTLSGDDISSPPLVAKSIEELETLQLTITIEDEK